MKKRSFPKFLKRLEEGGLKEEVERRAKSMRVSLLALYAGEDRAPSITEARKDVYAWLVKKGKGNNEIARLFDRAPSGISKMIREGQR